MLKIELLFWLHIEVIIVVCYHLFIIVMECEYQLQFIMLWVVLETMTQGV